ncbi:unnamed protein product, partial [Protopolystoma xenopodis]
PLIIVPDQKERLLTDSFISKSEALSSVCAQPDLNLNSDPIQTSLPDPPSMEATLVDSLIIPNVTTSANESWLLANSKTVARRQRRGRWQKLQKEHKEQQDKCSSTPPNFPDISEDFTKDSGADETKFVEPHSIDVIPTLVEDINRSSLMQSTQSLCKVGMPIFS